MGDHERIGVRRGMVVVVLVGLAWAAGLAQTGGALGEYRRGAEAMQAKDYQAAVRHLSAALAAAPSHPGLMADLARAHALAGDGAAAAARLAAALRLGSGLDVASDPAVARILEGEAGAALRAAAADLRSPISSSQEAFRVSERDLIPEGMAYDPVAKDFYVGSIHRRKIVRVDAAGRATDFIGEGRDGLLAVLGMKVDPAGRTLWAATEGTLSMRGGTRDDVGRSALVQYDLRTGRLLKKVELRPDPAPHLFNDLVLGGDGSVFLTDSEHGSVWRLRPGAGRLEPVGSPRSLEYPNGIALASDGRRLFVAHLAGIDILDLATGHRSPLRHPGSLTLAGIDGLYRRGHDLVAVQNGLEPPRIVVFTMTPGEDRVLGLRVLERGHPLFPSIPTTGAIAEDAFYYIANAQLRAFGPDDRIFPLERLQETVVLRTRLDAPAPGGNGAAPPDRFPLGQPPPGAEPVLFAPGIVSTGLSERDVAMTPDGREVYWTVGGPGQSWVTTMVSRLEGGRWSVPEVMEHMTDPGLLHIEPAVSPDGKLFLFTRAERGPGGRIAKASIWAMRREGERWGRPYDLGPPINDPASRQFFPSITGDGTLYFTRESGGEADGIYRSRLVDGRYAAPERLPAQVNAGAGRYNAFVNPGERYVIVPVEGREGNLGAVDYHVVFRRGDDTWTEPVNLGAAVNGAGSVGYSPYVSPDGRCFFFMSSRVPDGRRPQALSAAFFRQLADRPQNGNADIYWIDAAFIERLRPTGDLSGAAGRQPAEAR